jgi:NADH:ubiquinone oxidoreductase subunit F (NADH-binding)
VSATAPRVVVERLLAGTVDGRALSIAEHTAVHGKLPLPRADQLVPQLGHSGLAGRGGAGFPTARKLAAIVRAAEPKVVIANGAESEPMAEKDRVLLELTPHLVLDGLEIVARAAGARTAMIALGSAPSSRRSRSEADSARASYACRPTTSRARRRR